MRQWVIVTMAAACLALGGRAAAEDAQGVTSFGPDFFAAARPANALEMIRRLPGFALDLGANVRGFEGAAGNVLVDGARPATKTDTLDNILLRIPASGVARIDLIRGAAPGVDMQGKTVLANVILKKDGGVRGLAAIAERVAEDGRSLPILRLEGSGRAGASDWEAGLLLLRFADDTLGDGPIQRTTAEGRPLTQGRLHSEGTGVQETLTGAIEQPAWGGRLRFNGRVNYTPFHSDEFDTFTLPAGVAQTQHNTDTAWQTEFGTRYARALGSRTDLEIVGLRQDNREVSGADFQAPGDHAVFDLTNRTSETIGRAVARMRAAASLSLEAGAEVAFNTLVSATTFSVNAGPVAIPAANVRVEELRGEAFGKAVWRPVADVSLELSLRQERSRISSSGDVTLSKELSFTKPRIFVSWSRDPATQFRLRLEREVGQLDFNAFVASQALSSGVISAGNPNLEPQTDWVVEVAGERRFWGSGDLTLTLRHLWIQNAIDRAPIGTFDAPANIGDGSEDDLAASIVIPLTRLGLSGAELRATATWRRTDVIDPTTQTNRPISGLHPLDWEAHFVQDLPSHNLSWGVDALQGWRSENFRFDQIQLQTLGVFVIPYVVYKPSPRVEVRFEIDNAARRGFQSLLTKFDGTRGQAPPAFIESRRPRFGREFYMHLKRSFGGG